VHARLGLHLRIPVLVKLVGQVLGVLQRVGRIKIVVRDLRFFVVELLMFISGALDQSLEQSLKQLLELLEMWDIALTYRQKITSLQI